jgi:leader peptidase (prepilin peptidase)/N-methyltransferase
MTIPFALAGAGLGALIASLLDRFLPPDPDKPAAKGRRRTLLLSVAGAALLVICAERALDLRQFLLMSLFGVALLTLSATDFERRLLPNRIMYPCLVAGLLLCWAWPHRSVPSDLVGGATGAALMLGLFLVVPGFGFGDVKLAGLIGLILGFPAVVSGLLVGMVFGGIGSGWLLLSKRARLHSVMAYGPYLAGGAILEMLLHR